MTFRHRFFSPLLLRLLPFIAIIAIVGSFTSCRSRRQIESRPGEPHVEEITIRNHTKRGRKLVAEAKTWIGTPYQYGAQSKGCGADCSGMIMVVYEKVTGTKIPRNSAKQAEFCVEINASQVDAGDLVFFATGKDPNRISHVGMVIDASSFIHASSSKGVIVSNLDTPYYKRTFRKFGRVP